MLLGKSEDFRNTTAYWILDYFGNPSARSFFVPGGISVCKYFNNLSS